ncbi:hypothetical protein evm_009943 [Chilo suppressalis]|nr:hypothetical protein evm_009943 [Chilo suppressalis]
MNKPIRSSAREIIYKVYLRCLEKQQARTILSNLVNVYQRTADMTGKSISTVRRIVREGELNKGVLFTFSRSQHCETYFQWLTTGMELIKINDYHSEMNKNNFSKWVKEKLIPNLPPAFIVVMDNAPYHSVVLNKAPTAANKISEIREWWINNISFHMDLIKPQLLMLVKRYKAEPIYEIDELLGENGHTVGIAKQKIAAHNVGNIDIKDVAERAFQEITEQNWKDSCQHVQKIEDEYYEREHTLYENIGSLVFNLVDESTSSSESDDLDDILPGTSQEMARSKTGVKRNKICPVTLSAAMKDIRNGCSNRKAAEKYHLPKSTICKYFQLNKDYDLNDKRSTKRFSCVNT